MLNLLIGYTVVWSVLRIVAALDKKRAPLNSGTPQNLAVSVLVAAHNEESVVEQLVNNLTKLQYPNLEILIVDDRSTDRTAEILANLREANDRFDFYSRPAECKHGKAAVLNEAIQKLKGDVIVVFDADAQVEADFVTRVLPYFADDNVAAVQARKTASNGATNVLTRCQQFEFALDGYLQSKRDTIFGAVELRGNGMVIRRSALQTLGGFNEDNLTEDLDLCTRMHAKGWDLRYASDVQVWEEAMPALLPLMKQRVRWTEGSLIRYLEHAREILWSPKVAWRTKLDLIQFVFECILPVWLFTEIGLMIFRWWQGSLIQMPTLYAVPAAVVLSFYFVIVAFQGVGRFEKPSVVQSTVGAISVYSYLTFLWMPIVFIVLFGILTRSQRNSVWVKTEHFGSDPR